MQRKETFEELREKMLQSAKEGIKSAYSSEEYALIQAVNADLETEKSMNLAYERLTEWFGIYFPEVRMNNADTLASLAHAIATKSMTKEAIEEALKDPQRAEQIFDKAKQTIGRKMNDEEKHTVATFTKMLSDMSQSMDKLETYIKAASQRILPNVSYLTDEKIAAELLAKAGSMERLAIMPASTVQLLGAEKALFKHLKFGSKPPKYGVLFKMPVINGAPREIRGKIARAYATKICIALKADYYSKNFIAKKLKENLDATIKRIKEAPIKPKPQGKFQFQGGGPSRGHQNRPRSGPQNGPPHRGKPPGNFRKGRR